MKEIIVITREKGVRDAVAACFERESRIEIVPNRESAIDMLRKKHFDIIFIDLTLLRESIQGNRYGDALQPFRDLYPTVDIIIMTSKEMIREAVGVVKEGASDYITCPVDPEELRFVIDNLQESQIVHHELDYLRDRFWARDSLELIHSDNPLMREIYDKIRAVASTRSTVLLVGETGTGKGVLARILHKHSNRKDNQFISVHCGAIPDTLLESELFGHEKGAFTGAVRRKLGKFEIARGGTIFLDEIGTITPPAQIKLLQVLQDGSFQRVGGDRTYTAEARIIAATNADLKQMCEDGRFRKDLFYRLNVFPIQIPPLRDRIEDIPSLVKGFIKNMNRLNTKEISDIDPQVLDAFRVYSWPGNIRELENLIERAYILENSSILSPESFPSELMEFTGGSFRSPADSAATLAQARKRGVDEIERRYLRDVLTQSRGKIKDSSQIAGITTRQLHKLMTKYGLNKEDFR